MEKLTRDDLRNMKMGETKTFSLSGALACDAGKTTCYQMQNILKCKFSVSTDYVNNKLTVSKKEL